MHAGELPPSPLANAAPLIRVHVKQETGAQTRKLLQARHFATGCGQAQSRHSLDLDTTQGMLRQLAVLVRLQMSTITFFYSYCVFSDMLSFAGPQLGGCPAVSRFVGLGVRSCVPRNGCQAESAQFGRICSR
jgi:hypothetical protein